MRSCVPFFFLQNILTHKIKQHSYLVLNIWTFYFNYYFTYNKTPYSCHKIVKQSNEMSLTCIYGSLHRHVCFVVVVVVAVALLRLGLSFSLLVCFSEVRVEDYVTAIDIQDIWKRTPSWHPGDFKVTLRSVTHFDLRLRPSCFVLLPLAQFDPGCVIRLDLAPQPRVPVVLCLVCNDAKRSDSPYQSWRRTWLYSARGDGVAVPTC